VGRPGHRPAINSFAIRHNNHATTVEKSARSTNSPADDNSAKASQQTILSHDNNNGHQHNHNHSHNHHHHHRSSFIGGHRRHDDDHHNNGDDFTGDMEDEKEMTDGCFEAWHQYRPEGKLWDLCEQIGRFRREGKNRRDTSTVAARVLRLASMTGVLVMAQPKTTFNWKKKTTPPAASSATSSPASKL
jgi:hypothetical protein